MDALGAKTALPGSAGDAASTPPDVAVVAQLVALTTWGNAFLSRGADIAALNRDHSTLRVCNKVAFAEIRGLLRSREVPIAADPLTWLKLLREEGCRCIRLRRVTSVGEPEKSKNAPSVVPGSEPDWALETHFDDTADRWRARWSLTNRYAAQNRRWSVVYTRIDRKIAGTKEPNLEAAQWHDQLEKALQGLQEFASRQNQTHWSACLAQARSMLDSEKPLADSAYPDLLPRVGGSPGARQVLASCCQSLACDVDKTIPPAGHDPEQDRQDYERLAAAFYAAIFQSVEHSANLWITNPTPPQGEGLG